MTQFNAETLEEVTDEELAEQYDSYLDESCEYDICIDGNNLIPSEVLKSADPIAYDQSLNAYINSLYDAGELTSEWDRADRIKELCQDWAYMELASLVDHTTAEQDQVINAELFKLCDRDVLVVELGEIQLSSQHDMLDVMSALVTTLKEKTNKIDWTKKRFILLFHFMFYVLSLWNIQPAILNPNNRIMN